MSACIIVTQLVMIPVSTWVGSLAHAGRKPIFVAVFAVLAHSSYGLAAIAAVALVVFALGYAAT